MISYWHCCQRRSAFRIQVQEPSRVAVLDQGQLCHPPVPNPGDIEQCVEIFLVIVTGGVGGAIGIYWVEAKGAAEHPTANSPTRKSPLVQLSKACTKIEKP